METAQQICKRLHTYLREGAYTGRVAYVSGDRLDIQASFGLVCVLRSGALLPFSCKVSGVQSFVALGLKAGMDVLLDKEGIGIPEKEFTVDVTLAEDVDLALESMVNLFIPLDLPIRYRHLLPVLERHASSEDLSLLVISPDLAPELSNLRRPLEDLSAAFFDWNEEAVAQAAGACSGFGGGAVPASDALLCGYMACFSCLSYALGRKYTSVMNLTRIAASAAVANTNDSGTVHLLQAGEGLVGEDVFSLLRCLFSDVPYTSLTAAATRTAQGPNGVNLLAGVCLALNGLYLSHAA